MKTDCYVYGMRLRGFAPFCQPKDGILFAKDDINRKYWSILYYSRELTDKELRDYELDYIRKDTIETLI